MTTIDWPIHVIPVVDLMAGVVVRGVAGRRAQYRPLVSRLAPEPTPRAVANAFSCLGYDRVYLADLDAIAGGEPAWEAYKSVAECGLTMLVDAGVSEMTRVRQLATAGCQIVVGLETLERFSFLGEVVEEVGPDRMLFSLDLQAGRPLVGGLRDDFGSAPHETVPLELAERAVEQGVRRLILLDLAQVGMQSGAFSGTDELCRAIRERFPRVELISGGGVRGPEDLARLAAVGCDAALVASALHDGRLAN